MNSDTALQQSSIIERLILCVKTISGLGAIARDENFFRAGLSSIMLTRLKQTFPLSSAQKRIYFLSQLEEGEAAYHITAAAVIDGRLDVQAFKTAFRKLIQRHESLCTGFETRDDELVQRVHDHCVLEVTDLEMGTDDPDRVVREFVVPFDLSSPPLIRVGIGKIGKNRHFLIMDHIIKVSSSGHPPDNKLRAGSAGQLASLQIQEL